MPGAMANHNTRGSVKMDKFGVASAKMPRGTRDSLMLAIGRGDTDAVKRMVDEGGVDPNDPIHKDKDNWTPCVRRASRRPPPRLSLHACIFCVLCAPGLPPALPGPRHPPDSTFLLPRRPQAAP
eukprot:SAG22_NODE_11362_length_488_cov_1.323907_1_plen_123_part_10